MKEGRFKSVTNKIRLLTEGVDMIPLFGLDDATAALATGVAGVIDVVGCVLDNDYRGAGQELVEGAAETLWVALPYVEYARLAGIDGRAFVRELAGGIYNKLYDAFSGAAGDRKEKAAEKTARIENSGPGLLPAFTPA